LIEVKSPSIELYSKPESPNVGAAGNGMRGLRVLNEMEKIEKKSQ